jgi:hypothetical protein
MAVLVWVMIGIAMWHFTVFLPDHFWGGIVGAFLGALLGAFVFGWLIHGLDFPARDDVDILTALEGVPGSILGMAVVYFVGLRQERQHAPAPHPSGLS